MSVRDTSIDPRLLRSAREEFLRHGFLKADLKTICDNAGVTTGAVYKRYKGKEELFCAVVKDATVKMDSFISLRTNVDLSGMTDEQVTETWVMNEGKILEMFKMIWVIRKDFYLLLERS
nr:TetR/AcrR family transcriptional regulator [Saccharofermentans sp.]